MSARRERPLYRYPAAERRALARRLRGRTVELEVDALRDGREVRTYGGELIAVASPAWVGTVADLAILREIDGRELAFSLATVRAIRVAR